MKKLIEITKNNRKILLPLLIIIVVFCFLFRDVLFFGKTLRGEPFAGGVLPSGPAFYTGNTNIHRFLADPGASAWADNPLFVIASKQIKSGNFPWWNQFSATGSFLFADTESGISFPLKWPLILNPSPFMFDLFSLTLIFIGLTFTYLFLRRLGINRFIAAVSGFVFATSGALIRYANRVHLSNDALIPLYLFAVEYHVQKRTRWSFLLLFTSILLAVLALFPEASVFAITLPYLYFLFRTLQQDRKWPLIKDFIVVNLLVILISSPLLISFLKFYSQSWSMHPIGTFVGLDHAPLSILFSTVTPWVFNNSFATALNVIQYGQLGWFGGSILILGVLGLLTKGYKKSIGLFFAVYGIIFLLKSVGVWPFSLIGYLPIYNQLLFTKYSQPAITISYILSAAIFINYLYEKGSKLKHFIAGSLVFLVVFGYFFLMSYKLWFDLTIDRLHLSLTINYLLTFAVFGLFTALAAAVLIAILALIRFKKRRIIVAFILVVISVEAVLNFPKAFPERDVGYVPVKYVSAVQKNVGTSYRIAGEDYVLYTQIAGVYGIADIRTVDALILKDYMNFLKIIDPEVCDRFVTIDGNWLTKPAVLRMLGVKNILSTSSIGEIGLSNLPVLGISKDTYTISDSSREVFGLQPPVSKNISVVVPNGIDSVYFYLAMNPKVWDSSKGDGVTLRLTTSQGVSREFTIDPKNNPSDRIWHKIEFPVSTGQLNAHIVIEGNKSIAFDWTGITDFYSDKLSNIVASYYPLTKGFPIQQDSYLIRSYDVVDANQIAYFPKQVDFVSAKDFESEFKKQLPKIDQVSVALTRNGKVATVDQNFESQPRVSQKINGDTEVVLPKKHPSYLFISVPYTKNTRIKDQNGENLEFYKANIAFVLVKLSSGDEKIVLANTPSSETKGLFIVLCSSGIFLTLVYLAFYRRYSG